MQIADLERLALCRQPLLLLADALCSLRAVNSGLVVATAVPRRDRGRGSSGGVPPSGTVAATAAAAAAMKGTPAAAACVAPGALPCAAQATGARLSAT